MHPITKVALLDLSMAVNDKAGLANSSDRSMAIHTFMLLREDGIPFDPGEIRAWLISERECESEHADQFKNVAEGVLMGKNFRNWQPMWKPNILEDWKERVRGKLNQG